MSLSGTLFCTKVIKNDPAPRRFSQKHETNSKFHSFSIVRPSLCHAVLTPKEAITRQPTHEPRPMTALYCPQHYYKGTGTKKKHTFPISLRATRSRPLFQNSFSSKLDMSIFPPPPWEHRVRAGPSPRSRALTAPHHRSGGPTRRGIAGHSLTFVSGVRRLSSVLF